MQTVQTLLPYMCFVKSVCSTAHDVILTGFQYHLQSGLNMKYCQIKIKKLKNDFQRKTDCIYVVLVINMRLTRMKACEKL